jgi:hypothetical protein
MSLLESAGFSRANPYYVVQQGKVQRGALSARVLTGLSGCVLFTGGSRAEGAASAVLLPPVDMQHPQPFCCTCLLLMLSPCCSCSLPAAHACCSCLLLMLSPPLPLPTHKTCKCNLFWWVAQITEMARMTPGQRLELLKEVGGTKVYEERRRESVKIMAETESRRLQV